MRILKIIHQDPRKALGGSEVYCRHLIRGLQNAGEKVAVFSRTIGPGKEALEYTSEAGVDYYTVDLAALKSAKNRFQYTNSYANPEVFKIFEKVIADYAPDIVHIHHLLTLSVDIISTCRAHNIPVVATLHDYWYFCHRITLTLPDGQPCSGPNHGVKCRSCGKPIYNKFPLFFFQPGQSIAAMIRNKRLLGGLSLCDKIYAPSHTVLARYDEQGIDPNKLYHRPYGIAELPPRKRKLGKPVVFGYIGNLAPYKGIEVLIEAMEKARTAPCMLRIFGAGTKDYETELQARAKYCHNIHFSGRFEGDSLTAALESMDVLIVPSLWEENSPLVVHEASAAKLPVIASNIGGLSEIVSKERGGMVFTPGNATELAEIIRDLTANPDKIKAMQKQMRIIRTLEADLKQLREDYCELVEEKGKIDSSNQARSRP